MIIPSVAAWIIQHERGGNNNTLWRILPHLHQWGGFVGHRELGRGNDDNSSGGMNNLAWGGSNNSLRRFLPYLCQWGGKQ